MLTKLRSSLVWLVAGAIGLLSVFFGGKALGRKDQEIKQEKKARKVEAMGYEAAEAGRIKEQEIRKGAKDIDAEDRSFFE